MHRLSCDECDGNVLTDWPSGCIIAGQRFVRLDGCPFGGKRLLTNNIWFIFTYLGKTVKRERKERGGKLLKTLMKM